MEFAEQLRGIQNDINSEDPQKTLSINDRFKLCIESAELLDELLDNSEPALIKKVNAMCEESLEPNNFKKWEEVKESLELVRTDLK